MTIKAAASALIDDLVDSGSFLRTQVSACDYGVLEGNACAIVVQPESSTLEEHVYGALERVWGLRAECFIRDTGDVQATLTAVWDIHDAVDGAIASGSNLNTATRRARARAFTRAPDTFVEFQGNDYLPVYVLIEVREEC